MSRRAAAAAIAVVALALPACSRGGAPIEALIGLRIDQIASAADVAFLDCIRPTSKQASSCPLARLKRHLWLGEPCTAQGVLRQAGVASSRELAGQQCRLVVPALPLAARV